MLLSIIIPVYKVEKYIRNTLESIFSQEVDSTQFEVIVVNDGTPDNSMSIVSEFKNNYSNLHIINQTNQGLSCARNSGLHIAQGTFIWFVDSDDTVAPDSLNHLFNICQENQDTDILGFDIKKINESDQDEYIEPIIFKAKNKNLYNKSFDKGEWGNKIQLAPVQRFIFRHQFLIEYNLNFYPGIYHEDIEFMARALFFAKNIKMIPYQPYLYLIRTRGSIMSSKDIKSVEDIKKIIELLIEFKNNNAIRIKDKLFLDNYIWKVLNILFSRYWKVIPGYDKLIHKLPYSTRLLCLRGVFANIYYKNLRQMTKSFIGLLSCKLLLMINTND